MPVDFARLKDLSIQLRLDLLDMVYKNGGHFGGPLSSLDLLISLYFSNLFNFKSEKDKFILSAGHLAPALYVILTEAGYFDKSNLDNFSQFGSLLQGHSSTHTPGVLYSSGSLGQGLSFAAGLALANLVDRKKSQVICLTTDGEHQEGQIWEAAAFANKYKLKNLINIIDHNKYQIDGSLQDIMPLEDLASKYIRFGWTVKEVDGHDLKKITKVLKEAKTSNYPTCIVAHTVFAKGISFAQYDYQYHDIKNLDSRLYQLARDSLVSQLNHD